MPPSAGTAKDWLARAEGKLALAQAPLPPQGFLEDLCFFTQQAAELALKAVYQQHGWMFPFTHDLAKLLDGLQQNGVSIPAAVQDADQLSVYAVQTRYPGTYAPVTEAEWNDAVTIAQAVIAWAKTIVP